jgi:hypothetical protein
VGWHHNGLNRVQSVDRAASVALQEAARFVNGTAGSANLKSSCSEGNLPASAATQTARHVNHLVAAQLRLPSVECMTRPASAYQHIEMGQKWPTSPLAVRATRLWLVVSLTDLRHRLHPDRDMAARDGTETVPGDLLVRVAQADGGGLRAATRRVTCTEMRGYAQ